MAEYTLEQLGINYELMEARISQLEERIKELQEKKRKKQWGETKSKISLEEIKIEFVNSKPKERTDAFDDTELALWAVYILNGREVITSFPELMKRKQTARKVVDYFIGLGHTEENARGFAKSYLEYVLKSFPTFHTTDGEQKMNFWTACSDFALSHYSKNMEIWNVLNMYPDESLDD